MPTTAPVLPRVLLEDYLSLLRGLVVIAWVYLGATVATELVIRSGSVFSWPTLGGFSDTYHAILGEFAFGTLVLSALLVYRDWYERIPRESAPRVRWLLVAVVVWLALHLFCAFHVTGSVRGPLLFLLPVVMIAALVAFPGRGGWMATAFLIAGHALVVLLENNAVISPRGLLTEPFAYATHMTCLGTATVLMVMVAALMLAGAIRGWMYPNGPSLHPVQRIDPDTGLFRRAFLDQRIQMELGRMRRQGGCAALLLIALDNEPDGNVDTDRRAAASALLRQVRLESDTPAIYAAGMLAVLLPAAGPDGANSAARRIVSGLSAAGVPGRFRSASAVVSNGGVQPGQLIASAEAAVRRAQPGNDPVIVSVDSNG